MDFGDFFVTGDEWGLIEVVPAENRAHYDGVAEELAEHHKDTEFGPNDWTTPPFVLPGPVVSLSVRAIRPETLAEAFANILVPTDRVTTCVDFTGPPYPAVGCLAWKVPGNAHAAGFYGEVTDGIIESLWWSPHRIDSAVAEALADALPQLGRRYRLLLAVGGAGVIDLEDRGAVARYLAGPADEV
jgi:hypothetical protein